MSKVVGIDLGTTNSLVAYVDEGRPVVVRDDNGDGLVPSVVSVGEDGTMYVGREAQRRTRLAAAAKRFTGDQETSLGGTPAASKRSGYLLVS